MSFFIEVYFYSKFNNAHKNRWNAIDMNHVKIPKQLTQMCNIYFGRCVRLKLSFKPFTVFNGTHIFGSNSDWRYGNSAGRKKLYHQLCTKVASRCWTPKNEDCRAKDQLPKIKWKGIYQIHFENNCVMFSSVSSFTCFLPKMSWHSAFHFASFRHGRTTSFRAFPALEKNRQYF